MLDFMDLLAVVGLFALRVGVPIGITAGLVYLLKRLDRRWEMEARVLQERGKEAMQPAAQPGTKVRVPVSPQPTLPWVPPPAIGPGPAPQPGLMVAAAAQPCWATKGCSEGQRASCAAAQHPEVPCWQARFDAEGAIPDQCTNCEIFQRYPMM
ncbi:MAG: hypothetical protein ACP5UQ_08950 [Anaerolineae bacterium]